MGKPHDGEIRTVVTEALVGMIAGVTNMVPPTDQALPDFIQAPVDRAVERIKVLLAKHPASGDKKPVAHRLINEQGEVMTDWHDGSPPEDFTDLCGQAMKGVRVELAYSTQAAAQDVAGLVEALEQISKMDERSVLGSIPPIRQTQSIAIRALAAHRAQQGEQGE